MAIANAYYKRLTYPTLTRLRVLMAVLSLRAKPTPANSGLKIISLTIFGNPTPVGTGSTRDTGLKNRYLPWLRMQSASTPKTPRLQKNLLTKILGNMSKKDFEKIARAFILAHSGAIITEYGTYKHSVGDNINLALECAEKGYRATNLVTL